MKLLVIGIDGAHLETFRRGWTPNIEKLINAGDILPVHEDLITRGWARIITGQGAEVTGALYDRPDLNGTTGWSLKFNMNSVLNLGSKVLPIWQVLSEMNVKVGIMNVPTVFPAPVVNGFFVSGGGGGAPVVQEPTADFCFPENIVNQLREWDYIVDERPNSLLAEKGLTLPTEVFQRLSYKNSKRVEAFKKLSKEYETEFGFVVFKSSSVFAELLVMSELAAQERSGGIADSELMSAAQQYYREFDEQIKSLIDEYPAAEVLLVSDHGSIVPKWYLNPNSLLAKLGFQKASVSKTLLSSLIRASKKYLPYSLRTKLKKSTAVKAKWQGLSVSPPKGSVAFSVPMGSWRNGIYVNDLQRFGGTIDAADRTEISAKIAQAINEDEEMRRSGVTATTQAVFIEKPTSHYPDIILHMPDDVMTSPASTKVMSKVMLPKAPLGLASVAKGDLYCVKSSNALAVNLHGNWEITYGSSDLGCVYRHVALFFHC